MNANALPGVTRSHHRPGWIALLLVSAVVSACQATVEGQDKNFTRNVATVKALMVTHPGLEAPLQARLTEAEAAMKAARSKGGDGAAKAMSRINKDLMRGFVSGLDRVERLTRELRKMAVEVPQRATGKGDRLSALAAVEEANRVLTTAKVTLEEGAPTEAEADELVEELLSDLSVAHSNLRKVNKSSRPKELKDEKGSAPAKAGEPATGDQATK